MKKTIISFAVAIIFVSCNPLEKKLEGGWVVDQAYYNDEPVRWDLYSNGFDLKSDHTCHLPIDNWDYRRTVKQTGVWTAFEENGKTYLKIGTENWLFNRTFEVHNLRRVQDTVSFGYLMKMTLTADSLKMDCTKALYE